MEAQTEQTELFIALVAAVGTDIGLIGDLLQTHLTEYGFTSQLLRLSDYLAEQAENDFREKPFDEMLWDAMTAGDELRRRWDRSDALSLHAVTDIVATREQVAEEGGWASDDNDEPPPSLSRHAFILRSLKTPDELETLRAIYGPRLIVIAACSPEEMRERHLAELIEDSRQSSDQATWKHQPSDRTTGVRRCRSTAVPARVSGIPCERTARLGSLPASGGRIARSVRLDVEPWLTRARTSVRRNCGGRESTQSSDEESQPSGEERGHVLPTGFRSGRLPRAECSLDLSREKAARLTDLSRAQS